MCHGLLPRGITEYPRGPWESRTRCEMDVDGWCSHHGTPRSSSQARGQASRTVDFVCRSQQFDEILSGLGSPVGVLERFAVDPDCDDRSPPAGPLVAIQSLVAMHFSFSHSCHAVLCMIRTSGDIDWARHTRHFHRRHAAIDKYLEHEHGHRGDRNRNSRARLTPRLRVRGCTRRAVVVPVATPSSPSCAMREWPVHVGVRVLQKSDSSG